MQIAIIVKNKEILVEYEIDKICESAILGCEQTTDERLEIKKIFIPQGKVFTVQSLGDNINWIHIISGAIIVEGSILTNEQICFIPENKKILVKASQSALLVRCTVKNYHRYEKEQSAPLSSVKIINWKKEPVLQSQHDNRKRIYVATKSLWGTDAVKGEMILYPKDASAPAHYHIGAEHFQFVLSGEGIAFTNGMESHVETGDLIYNFENEIHWFKNQNSELFSFVEFFVPGSYQTNWTETEKVCTWLPTNRNLNGGAPSRNIIGHRSDQKIDL